MIDYDYCERMAMAEAMPIIAKAVENVPQATEASEMIKHYISVGVRLMKGAGVCTGDGGEITMAQLAIKGHATRGKEVIEILEMLGGKQGNYS